MKRALLITFILVLTGCHQRRTPARALPPAPLPTVTPAILTEPVRPPLEPQPLPVPDIPAPPAPEPNATDLADAAFSAGNYSEAARIYESILHRDKAGEQRDGILFRFALSLAVPQNANTDWNRISAILKQLVDQYPRSPLKPSATVILNLLADSQRRDQRIKQLTNELDKLKQIDADKRKRPPAR